MGRRSTGGLDGYPPVGPALGSPARPDGGLAAEELRGLSALGVPARHEAATISPLHLHGPAITEAHGPVIFLDSRAPYARRGGDDDARPILIHPSSLLRTIGGPIALGAALGLPAGAGGLLRQAATLPGIVLGLTLLMAPALYIGSSLLGLAPPAADALRAAGRALRACGTLLLGLAPATAFLLATASDARSVALGLGGAVLASGALCGLRLLFGGLYVDRGRPSARPAAVSPSGRP